MHKDIRLDIEIHGVSDQASLDMWRHEFNKVRPHESLNMKTPSDVYRKSKRLFNSTPPVIEYPQGYELRRVTRQGRIKFNNVYYSISSSLAGLDVGVKRRNESRFEVWFDYLHLGDLDEQNQLFIRYDEC